LSNRYAILIDGAFFFRKLWSTLKRRPEIADVMAECMRIRNHTLVERHDLLRIYYYDAFPATGTIKNPISGVSTNLGETEVFRKNMAFLQSLELQPDISLRRGETAARGWNLGPKAIRDLSNERRELVADDFVPNIEQKGVDLRIGLDIARLSLRSLVQEIVVVTGDSDLVPAFRFARREGVRIYLCHMGHGVVRDLKAHTDAILDDVR